MKATYKYLVVFATLTVVYLLFGAGAWLMPDAPVERHIKRTLDMGDMSSDQPRAFMPLLQCRMDNFTDALILNQVCTMTTEDLVDGTLLVPRRSCGLLPFEDLRAIAEGSAEMETIHYGRYWHGSTFLTRYLLVAYDFVSIRLLLYIVTSLLMVWCAVVLWRKGGWQLALAVMFGLAVSYAFMMQFSVQFAMVLILSLAGMIAVAKGRGEMMTFFVIGTLTCFFDLLTAPMLTLGLMLVVQAALMHDGGLWSGWWRSLRSALLWAAGYLGTWVTKWIIATLITSENVISDGIANTANRSGIGDFSRWDAVVANTDLLPWQYIYLSIFVTMVLCAIWFNVKGWHRAVQILPIALIPWVWYAFAANHSYWHNWFTFRAQAVSVAAILLALMQMVDWERFRDRIKQLKR